MRTTAIALLASVALALPVAAQNDPSSQDQNPDYGSQTQGQNSRNQNRNRGGGWRQQGANQGASNQTNANPSTAQNTTISPRQLNSNQIKQVQSALNSAGFNVGDADGRWGQKSQSALKNFEQSKGIQPSGKLNKQALDQLGLNSDQFIMGHYGSSRGPSNR